MKCLKCGKMLVEPGKFLNNGSILVDSETSVPLESENGDTFMRCKHCGAKNIMASDSPDSGPEKLYFVRYED